MDNVSRFSKNRNWGWLWNSDVFVFPSFSDGFGLVLLEAMAAGLPVIALDGRGNRDIMKDGENGFMLKEQNATVFVEKIELVYKNQELYDKLSRGALQTAKTYDISEYVEKLMVVYQSN